MDARSKALWRRHWFDSWGGLIVATLVAIVLCAVFAARILIDAANDFTQANDLAESIAPLSVLADARELSVWFAHALMTAIASFGLILFIHGTGIRSNDLTAAHPSIYFNLTLPVSRTRLVVTRFVVTAIWALALIGTMLLINYAILSILGLPIPAMELAQTSFLGLLFLITFAWILDSTLIFSETLGHWLLPVAVLALVTFSWSGVLSLVAGHPVTPLRIATLIALAALALAGGVAAAHKRDF